MSKKVISATITPLNADGTLDKVGLRKVLERNIRQGVDGFFLLGSMGEWGSFSDAFKEETVAEAAAITRGKAELLVGINATSLGLALTNMKCYRGYDFDSYVFMLPAATSNLDPVKSILTVLDKADRPVYYYHCPPNNNKNLTLAQFADICRHPNLKGIKNSAGNMWLGRELVLLRAEQGFKTLFMEGQEWAIDEALLCGYDGMVCGMGALAGKFLVGIARAAERGDWNEAVRLQNRMIVLFHGVYGPMLETVIPGQKYALMKLGLIASPFTFASEMNTLTDVAKARIDHCLETMKEEID